MAKIARSKRKGAVFVTRESNCIGIEVRPAAKGITQRPGRINRKGCVCWLNGKGNPRPFSFITKTDCKARFGFYPREGTAYLVVGKKHTKVNIDFS